MNTRSSRRADPQLLALSRYIENMAYRRPIARSTAHDRLAELDGIPGGSDAPKVSATSELTSVERIAAQRLHIQGILDQEADDLIYLVQVAAAMTKHYDWMIAERITIEPVEKRICDANNRDGYLIEWTPGKRLDQGNGWADLTCNNIASRGALCDSCAMREYRWREHRGLPPRADGVFTGEPVAV